MYFTPRDAIKFKKSKQKNGGVLMLQQQHAQMMQNAQLANGNQVLQQRKISIGGNNGVMASYMN